LNQQAKKDGNSNDAKIEMHFSGLLDFVKKLLKSKQEPLLAIHWGVKFHPFSCLCSIFPSAIEFELLFC
jgi:hypothetical protein